MPERAEKYLKLAEECRVAAERANNPEAKAELQKLAERWRLLAERRAHGSAS